MGLFKKILGGAEKVYDAKETLEHQVFHDHRFDRAEKLAAEGDPNTAVITGIRRRYNGDFTETDLRLEWYSPEPRVGGIHYGADLPLTLRLGSTIAVKTDGDTVVVDPAAMAGVPGAPTDAARSTRKAPDRGADDKALVSQVLSRVGGKWTPQEATVESFERHSVLGLPSENWDVTVVCSDGTRALVKRDYVPPYVRWYVAPGAVVPVVVDPKDPARAQVNWPLLAEQRAVAGGTWRDDPPAGSIAESLLRTVQRSGAEPVAAPESPGLTPSDEPSGAIEGLTLEQCAYIEAALIKDRVAPAQYDPYAEQYGAPAGRYTAIKAQWDQRIRTDWRVGAAFGEAFDAARKGLKKR